MALYLINGLPASGKSTVGQLLAARGYSVVDADQMFGYYGQLMFEVPVTPPANLRKLNRAWYADHGWLWNTAKISQFLAEPHEDTVFVVGSARNEKRFYGHFAKIFTLHISNDALRQRLSNRQDPLQNNEVFIHRTLVWNHTAVDLAKNINAELIDANGSAELSLRQILEHLDA